MKLTVIKVRGIEIEVDVDAGGMFHADFGGRGRSAHTLAELIAILQKASKEASAVVSVRGKLLIEGEWHEVIGYGVHAGTGNLLYQVDGKKKQHDTFRFDAFKLDTPVSVLLRYAEIIEIRRSLDREHAMIEKRYEFSMTEEVRTAVRVAAQAQQEVKS